MGGKAREGVRPLSLLEGLGDLPHENFVISLKMTKEAILLHFETIS